MKLEELKEAVVPFRTEQRKKEVEMSRRLTHDKMERRQQMSRQYNFTSGDLNILKKVVQANLLPEYERVVPLRIQDKVQTFVWDQYSDEFATQGITDDEFPDWLSDNLDRVIDDIVTMHEGGTESRGPAEVAPIRDDM